MHGRGRRLFGVLLLLGQLGCTEQPPQPDAPRAIAVTAAGAVFQPSHTGTIAGRVGWKGPLPQVPPFMMMCGPDNAPPDGRRLSYVANPFRPLVEPAGAGVQDVVIFLRAVNSQFACAWPHSSMRVEQVERTIRVSQDGVTSRVGFVRRGDAIEAVNRDAEYHSLRARGVAFFTLPFVEADRITQKRLDQAGIVDLSSGAGYFWMHAHLFVVEHPYYARTDSAGRFRLDHVPAGRYEVVCWLPSWVVARKERDPESGFISRLAFAPPVQQTAAVEVRAAATSKLDFAWSEGQMTARGNAHHPNGHVPGTLTSIEDCLGTMLSRPRLVLENGAGR